MITNGVAAATGWLVDLAFGEPPARWHPVAWFGTAMGAVERRLYRDSRVAGVVHLAVGVGGENSYGGVAEDRGRLGDGGPPAPADGARAIRLARHTAIAFAVACATLPNIRRLGNWSRS